MECWNWTSTHQNPLNMESWGRVTGCPVDANAICAVRFPLQAWDQVRVKGLISSMISVTFRGFLGGF